MSSDVHLGGRGRGARIKRKASYDAPAAGDYEGYYDADDNWWDDHKWEDNQYGGYDAGMGMGYYDEYEAIAELDAFEIDLYSMVFTLDESLEPQDLYVGLELDEKSLMLVLEEGDIEEQSPAAWRSRPLKIHPEPPPRLEKKEPPSSPAASQMKPDSMEPLAPLGGFAVLPGSLAGGGQTVSSTGPTASQEAAGVASASGAQPGSPVRARAAVVVQAGPKVLEGTGGPFPDDFWDPAGLAKGKSDEQLIHWRNVELKHGRVCMLACLGWFHVAAGWHPIGDGAARVRVSDDPLVAVTQLPIGGAFQVVFTIMCFEWMITQVIKPNPEKPWDVLGWSPVIYEDEPDWKETQLKELNNGRLAMMGFIGLVSQDLLTGDYFPGIAQPGFGAWAGDVQWSAPY